MRADLLCPFCGGSVQTTIYDTIQCLECVAFWDASGQVKKAPPYLTELTCRRAVYSIAPRQALGYDVANAVGMLFQQLRHDNIEVEKLLIPSIRVTYAEGVVTAVAYVNVPETKRYACGCNGRPHWGPGECRG